MPKTTSRIRLKFAYSVVLTTLLIVSAGSQGVLAADYAVTDLGTLGGSESFAQGINEAGMVTGESDIPGDETRHAFLYSGGTMIDVGTLGVPTHFSFGAAINDAGQVVGESSTWRDVPSLPHAFLYSGGTLTDLGTGGTRSAAFGINAAGQIVGDTENPNGSTHAFLHSGGTVIDLGTLGGGRSNARAINAAGHIVGYSDTLNGGDHAFLYRDGTMIDLGTLGGGTNTSVAYGINGAGQIVGVSSTDPGLHAFLHSGGTMIDLGTLGGRHSTAFAINDTGQIVGQSDIAGMAATHAFLYSGGTMTDLNAVVPAGVTVTSAKGINSAGQIAAVGTTGAGTEAHALILTPKSALLNRFAYAWANSPMATSYEPDRRYAYNSSGSGISIARQDIGIYDVTFHSLPGWGTGLSSAVAVTTYGSSTITCSVVTYSSSSTSAVAKVACFDVVTKRLADSRFTVMIVGNQSVPAPSAFVMSGGPSPVGEPNPAWSWTTGGNPITVTHNAGPGDYKVLLGTEDTPKGAKLITGTTGGGTRCNYAQDIPGGLEVQCYDWTGAAMDQGFSVVQVAGGRPNRRIGFAIADQSTTDSYTPSANSAFNSSGGEITATRSAIGQYTIEFAGLQKLSGHTEHVQVTPFGTTLSTCNVVNWNNSTSGGLKVRTECRNGAGEFMDSQYNVLVIE
jgi:probable HAF family extracellular repeat protein